MAEDKKGIFGKSWPIALGVFLGYFLLHLVKGTEQWLFGAILSAVITFLLALLIFFIESKCSKKKNSTDTPESDK